MKSLERRWMYGVKSVKKMQSKKRKTKENVLNQLSVYSQPLGSPLGEGRLLTWLWLTGRGKSS